MPSSFNVVLSTPAKERGREREEGRQVDISAEDCIKLTLLPSSLSLPDSAAANDLIIEADTLQAARQAEDSQGGMGAGAEREATYLAAPAVESLSCRRAATPPRTRCHRRRSQFQPSSLAVSVSRKIARQRVKNCLGCCLSLFVPLSPSLSLPGLTFKVQCEAADFDFANEIPNRGRLNPCYLLSGCGKL